MVGVYHGNLDLLKAGTVIAGLFCLRHIDFVMTLTDRIGRKIVMIGLSFLGAKLISSVFGLTTPGLVWIVADVLFTWTALRTVLGIVQDIVESRR